MKQSVFSGYHPIVSFTYFMIFAAFIMLFINPLFLTISLIAVISLSVMLGGSKALKFNIFYMLPMILLYAVINPFFSRKGATILFYISRNAITLESVLYGIFSATMLITVIILFGSFNAVITEDKFIYLFSRLPSTALIISMALRLIPRFGRQIKMISKSRKAIGADPNSGNILKRAKSGLTIISILLSWAIESAIETADSMKARGYGLSGRSTFSLFKFERRDAVMMVYMLVLSVSALFLFLTGKSNFSFYPRLGTINLTPVYIANLFIYFVFVLIPIFLEIRGEILWRR